MLIYVNWKAQNSVNVKVHAISFSVLSMCLLCNYRLRLLLIRNQFYNNLR